MNTTNCCIVITLNDDDYVAVEAELWLYDATKAAHRATGYGCVAACREQAQLHGWVVCRVYG